jgi:hypothetical protein
MHRALFVICESTNERTIMISIFKLKGSYMFRHTEDDTFGVETCSSLIILYIFIIIVRSLVDSQITNNARCMY